MLRLLIAALALTTQGALALTAGPLLAPRPAAGASRAALIVCEAPYKYKRKSYIERLKGPSSATKGRKVAQEKREAIGGGGRGCRRD